MMEDQIVGLEQAVAVAMRSGGDELLAEPKRFVSYVADLIDPDSRDTRVIYTACDGTYLEFFATALSKGTPEAMGEAVARAADFLHGERMIDAQAARAVSAKVGWGVAKAAGIAWTPRREDLADAAATMQTAYGSAPAPATDRLQPIGAAPSQAEWEARKRAAAQGGSSGTAQPGWEQQVPASRTVVQRRPAPAPSSVHAPNVARAPIGGASSQAGSTAARSASAPSAPRSVPSSAARSGQGPSASAPSASYAQQAGGSRSGAASSQSKGPSLAAPLIISALILVMVIVTAGNMSTAATSPTTPTSTEQEVETEDTLEETTTEEPEEQEEAEPEPEPEAEPEPEPEPVVETPSYSTEGSISGVSYRIGHRYAEFNNGTWERDFLFLHNDTNSTLRITYTDPEDSEFNDWIPALGPGDSGLLWYRDIQDPATVVSVEPTGETSPAQLYSWSEESRDDVSIVFDINNTTGQACSYHKKFLDFVSSSYITQIYRYADDAGNPRLDVSPEGNSLCYDDYRSYNTFFDGWYDVYIDGVLIPHV